jgi:hypothetical protein
LVLGPLFKIIDPLTRSKIIDQKIQGFEFRCRPGLNTQAKAQGPADS